MNPFNSNDPIKFVPPQTPKTPTKAPLRCSNICPIVVTMIMVMTMMTTMIILTGLWHTEQTFDEMPELALGEVPSEKFLIVHCAPWFLVSIWRSRQRALQRLNCSVVGQSSADSLNPLNNLPCLMYRSATVRSWIESCYRWAIGGNGFYAYCDARHRILSTLFIRCLQFKMEINSPSLLCKK